MAGISSGLSGASYLNSSVSSSFSSKLDSIAGGKSVVDNYLNKDLKFGVDVTGDFNSVAENLSGVGALSGGGGWTFITSPEDISWDVANDVNRVDVFGTNNPPAVAGSRGMRDLTLGNSLAEGFVRGVSLEGKIAALESLMNYGLNSSEGFVSVPVYQVWANNKSYGGSNAYYIIKSVKVKEAMRDLQGNATRAYVDVSLMQVPAYQVNSGRDQASQATLAPGAAVTAAQKGVAGQADQNIPGPGSTTAANAANAKPAAGAGAGNGSDQGGGTVGRQAIRSIRQGQ